MTLGLIGNGFVGNAIYENLKSKYHFLIYDRDHERGNTRNIAVVCENSKLIFVALPTPMTESGECDLTILFDVLGKVAKYCKNNIVVLKSTVVPGTCEKISKMYPHMNLVFSPEFLTEKNSINDFRDCSRVIFSGKEEHTKVCEEIFKDIFPEKEYLHSDWRTAEMVKYFLNTFLATKVSFANEMYQICDSLHIEYNKVLELALKDNRLNKTHFLVPGPDGDFGFGGTCFPKDINALMNLCKEQNVDCGVLSAVWNKNNLVRSNLDWLQKVGRAVSKKENKDATIKSSTGSHYDGAPRVAVK